jgi:hypothetical protein
MSKKKKIQEQTAAELEATLGRAQKALEGAAEELPGLMTLTLEERKASDGRFRDGEPRALEAVLDVAEAYPGSFAVLADRDGGVDPTVFETARLRDSLRSAELLGRFADALEALARDVRDTQLLLGEAVRRPLLAAYEIAKPLAKLDAGARSKLAPAIDFYAAPAARAAKSRAAKKPE